MRVSLVPIAIIALLSSNVLAQNANSIRESRTLHVATAAGLPLEVETRNGSIEIVRSDSTEMVVTATVWAKTKEEVDKIKVGAANDPNAGNVVKVTFPQETLTNEGCSLRIEIPRAKNVTATTGNGAITASGMSGIATLQTSNGAVVVRDLNGSAKIVTSNGPVTLELADAASGPVNVESSNGKVEVVVGSGFNGTVDMATTNGRVTYPKSAKPAQPPSQGAAWGKDSAVVTLGSGGDSSKIRSSNGEIQIRLASEPGAGSGAHPGPKDPGRH